MNFGHLNREVWPQSDCFGSTNAQPEEDLLLLRDIFMTNLNSGEFQIEINSSCIGEILTEALSVYRKMYSSLADKLNVSVQKIIFFLKTFTQFQVPSF